MMVDMALLDPVPELFKFNVKGQVSFGLMHNVYVMQLCKLLVAKLFL